VTQGNPQTAPHPKRVLVVDDERDLVEAMRIVLESEGFGVETASNGQEALTALRGGEPPELVLLDMMMPVMNGWQLLSEVAKIPALKSVPVVVLTAAGVAGLAGVVEILRKPIDLELLVEAVGRHV